MAVSIHPTAIVEPGAQLGVDVELGAYAFVGAGVQLGDGTRLHHHASVEGRTSLGKACEIFPYACIGGKTQDLKFKGGAPGLRIGERNVFREYVTIHAATYDGDFTVIGSGNAILAYGQSGQFNESDWLTPSAIDQRVLFEGNSVLRGQQPRVDESANVTAAKGLIS